MFLRSGGAFVPERDGDGTAARRVLGLCVPVVPFIPGLSDLVWGAWWGCAGSAFVLSSSCPCLALVWGHH